MAEPNLSDQMAFDGDAGQALQLSGALDSHEGPDHSDTHTGDAGQTYAQEATAGKKWSQEELLYFKRLRYAYLYHHRILVPAESGIPLDSPVYQWMIANASHRIAQQTHVYSTALPKMLGAVRKWGRLDLLADMGITPIAEGEEWITIGELNDVLHPIRLEVTGISFTGKQLLHHLLRLLITPRGVGLRDYVERPMDVLGVVKRYGHWRWAVRVAVLAEHVRVLVQPALEKRRERLHATAAKRHSQSYRSNITRLLLGKSAKRARAELIRHKVEQILRATPLVSTRELRMRLMRQGVVLSVSRVRFYRHVIRAVMLAEQSANPE